MPLHRSPLHCRASRIAAWSQCSRIRPAKPRAKPPPRLASDGQPSHEIRDAHAAPCLRGSARTKIRLQILLPLARLAFKRTPTARAQGTGLPRKVNGRGAMKKARRLATAGRRFAAQRGPRMALSIPGSVPGWFLRSRADPAHSRQRESMANCRGAEASAECPTRSSNSAVPRASLSLA